MCLCPLLPLFLYTVGCNKVILFWRFLYPCLGNILICNFFSSYNVFILFFILRQCWPQRMSWEVFPVLQSSERNCREFTLASLHNAPLYPCFLLESMISIIMVYFSLSTKYIQGGPKIWNLQKNCVFTCLNSVTFSSTLHSMPHTYQDFFSAAQNSFSTCQFWCLLVLLPFFVSPLPYWQIVSLWGLFS